MATKAEVKPVDNMRYFNVLRTPPEDALKPIKGGRLAGRTDINPQWRYEALTAVFGPCGIGWKYEVTSTEVVPCTSGEVLLFIGINLYYKENDEWSAPVPGFGGDAIVSKEKGQLVTNDEAYKMATTDAIGTAAKIIGVASDVYRGRMDSKYDRKAYLETQTAPTSTPPKSNKQSPADASFDAPPPEEPPAPPVDNTVDKVGFTKFGKPFVDKDPKTKDTMILTHDGYKKIADIPDELLSKLLLLPNYEAAWLEVQQHLANRPAKTE